MKIKLHPLVLCFALGLLSMLSFSQCPTVNITLSSQTEINAFLTNYPDCTMLTESLTISGTDITDLTPLSNLTYIPSLVIIDNSQLAQLDGLHNLVSSIPNSTGFQIEGNPLLSDLSVFEGITFLSHLSIENCPLIENLEGLNFVTDFDSIGIFVNGLGGINISNNNALTDISALGNISNANIDTTMWPFSINIVNNPILISLSGLQVFEGIFDSLRIINNDSLVDLNGLSSNFSIGNYDFAISDNDSLESLGNIGGVFFSDLTINNNLVLTDISALNNFSGTGYLNIFNNPNLAICNNDFVCSSIEYFQPLADFYPYFLIENNAEGCNSVGEVAYTCGTMPFNDDCEEAIQVNIGETFVAYNEFATVSPQVPSCNDNNRIDVWFNLNSGTFASIDILVESGYNIQLWEGTCSNLIQVDNACGESPLIDIPVNVDTDYFIQVWSDSATERSTGLFDILVQDATLTTENFTIKDFIIYPNPTNNILNLKSDRTIDFVKVYNLLGQLILSSTPKALTEEINLTELNSGVYLISVEINNRSVVYRVIKE